MPKPPTDFETARALFEEFEEQGIEPPPSADYVVAFPIKRPESNEDINLANPLRTYFVYLGSKMLGVIKPKEQATTIYPHDHDDWFGLDTPWGEEPRLT